MYNCKYCKQEFLKDNELRGHMLICKENPKNALVECPYCHHLFYQRKLNHHHKYCSVDNPKTSWAHNSRQHVKKASGKNWAKGLTKDTDERIARCAQSVKKYYMTHDGSFKGKQHSENTRAKISQKLTEYNHENQNRNLHSKGGYFNGIYFMSTWELAYYIYCIDRGINIERCTKRFAYFYKNKKHYYTPDFIVNDQYIEIKGREIDKDAAKYAAVHEQHLSLKVIYKEEISAYIDYVKKTYDIKTLTTLYAK